MRIPTAIAGMTILAAIAGGCSSYGGGSLAAQVSNWASTTGFWPQVQTIRADAARVGEVEGRGDAGALRADCIVLSNDTRGAYQLLPTPDSALSSGLDQALQLEQTAAGDCYKGASGDAGLLASSDTGRARAAIALGAACALYRRLGGSGGCQS